MDDYKATSEEILDAPEGEYLVTLKGALIEVKEHNHKIFDFLQEVKPFNEDNQYCWRQVLCWLGY